MSGTGQEQLETLLQELQEWTAYNPADVREGLGDSMPLVHGFPCKGDGVDRAIAHPSLEDRGRSANASSLGLDGLVFYWIGSAAYPEPDVIFIWDPLADGPDACPWDAGGLMSVGPDGRRRSATDAKALLERYTLPSQVARLYLSHVAVACFRKPADYVRAVAPAPAGKRKGPWYPGRSSYARVTVDPPSYTFEAHAPAPAAIDPHLMAIVADVDKLKPQQLRGLRERARRNKECMFVPCTGGERPYERARRYIEARLRDLGLLT